MNDFCHESKPPATCIAGKMQLSETIDYIVRVVNLSDFDMSVSCSDNLMLKIIFIWHLVLELEVTDLFTVL